jgi:hypothetical protein
MFARLEKKLKTIKERERERESRKKYQVSVSRKKVWYCP